MRLKISGARMVDPAARVDAVRDVYVADGRVAAIGKRPDGFSTDREIDARNRVLIPGLVDLSARLREPGAEHKATVASETRAAARGGITTLCIPPDTDPVVDTPAVVELIHQRAAASGMARVEVLGALTRGLEGNLLAEMGALRDAGCIGVSNAYGPVGSTEVMRRAMEYA
ncbi:MAG: dihydroorotase, partial [Gammaproteobacteria bacterium]|nr:dihydroorotase [Gammaproteobacteria bacterium]